MLACSLSKSRSHSGGERFSLEYEKSLQLDGINDVGKMRVSHLVHFLALSKEYRNVTTFMAHLLVTMPNVEHLICTNVTLKPVIRNRLSAESGNGCLHIDHNMPPLVERHPRVPLLLFIYFEMCVLSFS